MIQTMGQGSEDHANVGDEYHSAEKSIEGRKNFSAHIFDINHGSHATEDHRSIMKSINKGSTCNKMIAQHTNHQATSQYGKCKKYIVEKTFIKYSGIGKRLCSPFVHEGKIQIEQISKNH